MSYIDRILSYSFWLTGAPRVSIGAVGSGLKPSMTDARREGEGAEGGNPAVTNADSVPVMGSGWASGSAGVYPTLA